MNVNDIALKAILVGLGAFVLVSGLDIALGGFHTMGWMDPVVFFEVTDPAKFAEMDNHHRFLGGVWTGIGVFLLLATIDLRRYEQMLTPLFAMVFIGGLARLSQLDAGVLLLPGVLWAIVVELIGMPLMFYWVKMTVQRNAESPAG